MSSGDKRPEGRGERHGERHGERQGAIAETPGAPPPADEIPDHAVVGRPAIVTIRIPGGRAPGEVRLYVRGTYESLIAYALEPLEAGRHVVVVSSRGGRAAHVEPTTRGT